MSLLEASANAEHAKSSWLLGSRVSSLGYYFGNQYYGPYAERLIYNIGLIEQICRDNYLPPIVLGSFKPSRDEKVKTSMVKIEPMEQVGEEGLSIGWQIKVNGDTLLNNLQQRQPLPKTNIDSLFIRELDGIIKQSMFKIGWFETLDLRLQSNAQIREILYRSLKQVGGIVGAYLASEAVEDPVAKTALGLFGLAVIQNYIAFDRDIYDSSDRNKTNSRSVVQQWRALHFPERYKKEAYGPGFIKNGIIHSIPFAEMAEPAYRFVLSGRDLRYKLLKMAS